MGEESYTPTPTGSVLPAGAAPHTAVDRYAAAVDAKIPPVGPGQILQRPPQADPGATAADADPSATVADSPLVPLRPQHFP